MTVQRDAASEAQVRAANPQSSTWLSANAGSGKTRVLTDRVARLLLEKVDPQQILCLTYTKAAASEMQNRLFARLGAWAMQPEDTLRADLHKLGVEGVLDSEALEHARTLFARAIETPGGLKIQTIHSFCAGLLRRFPLEAQVSPLFEEMEDRAAQLLQAEIVEAMTQDADAALVRDLAQNFTGAEFSKFLGALVSKKQALTGDFSHSDAFAMFDLPLETTPEGLAAKVLIGGEEPLLAKAISELSALTASDQKIALAMQDALLGNAIDLPKLKAALLTNENSVRARLSAKKVVDALGSDASALLDLAGRLQVWVDDTHALNAANRTFVLRSFASRFIARYEEAKRQRGWLDFDDLIQRTRDLLTNEKVAAWVLYRLDGGISHLLVDEAQDTSPAQWDVIKLLTQEFTSGLGAREDVSRTLFVVGDKKQSIYSFQGADPDEFDRMEAFFRERLGAVGSPFQSRNLDFSFRSSNAILRLVDATFDGKEGAGFVPDQRHRAFHETQPGRIDLWPLVEKSEADPEVHWTDPVDRIPSSHHDVRLAAHVADQIAALLNEDAPEYLPERIGNTAEYSLRPVKPGDIMVLVQRRSPLFQEIIKACKARNLPIAGADRLRVGAELAVRDLLALLSFLVTPEDDLSLATVLRSPLFGWTEQQIFSLCHNRSGYVWEALRKQKDAHPQTFEALSDLRDEIDFLRPFDLLERILTRHRGRANLIARLGAEAEDGINALLTQALAYERSNIPSLTGFLVWAQADDLEIKRQADTSGGLIRVMTAHGAKGLEAPIVILPDTSERRNTIQDEILTTERGPMWRAPKDAQPSTMRAVIDARKTAEQAERMRLLYVAMTRAETWLILAAAGSLSKDGSDWYSTISEGMDRLGALPQEFSAGPGSRYELGNWDGPASRTGDAETAKSTVLEPLFEEECPTPEPRQSHLSPSDLDGAKALASDVGLPEEIAKLRGTYVHALLELTAGLRKSLRPQAMKQIAASPLLSAELIASAQTEVKAVLEAKDLAWIFHDDALKEVSVHGKIAGQSILGTIDSLIVGSDRVIIVDYKTNMAVPKTEADCPEGILRQMGAYAAIMGQIYPNHRIETGILWTHTASFMSLSQNQVNDALWLSPKLDATGGAT